MEAEAEVSEAVPIPVANLLEFHRQFLAAASQDGGREGEVAGLKLPLVGEVAVEVEGGG